MDTPALVLVFVRQREKLEVSLLADDIIAYPEKKQQNYQTTTTLKSPETLSGTKINSISLNLQWPDRKFKSFISHKDYKVSRINFYQHKVLLWESI